MADALMAQEVFCTLQIGRRKVGRMTYKLESDGWHYQPRFGLGVEALRAFAGGRISTRNVKAAALAAKIIQERTLAGPRFVSLRAAAGALGRLDTIGAGALPVSTGGAHVC